jgi:RES domain-containing protein
MDFPRKIYRIADGRHPLLDGTGAFVNGGRWNSPGKLVIYAAETYAGALLEQLAHANLGRLPGRQVYVEIEIPKHLTVEYVRTAEVAGWNAADLRVARERGDAWFRAGGSAILMVPSAVTGGIEWNVLISQTHPDFSLIQASEPKPVIWDRRLLRS